MASSRVWLGRSSRGIDAQQGLGVGVPHLAEEGLGGGLLDDAPGVHHRDVVGPGGDHAEVVGDQHHGHVALALLGLEQVEDLGLDGDVEGGGGLVGEEQAGAAGQGDGDDHPLAHAAGELLGVLLEAPLRLGDADRAQQGDGGLLALGLGVVEVLLDRLGDLVADALHGVQRGHRVLEHHGHLRAPDLAEHVGVGVEHLAAVEAHAAGAAGVGGDEAHDRAGQDRLARAGLAHDAEGPAPLEGEVDVLDGADGALAGA